MKPKLRLIEYRTLLSARILYLLVNFDSEPTVEDIKQLIFEHDGTTYPSECFADMIPLFRAGEDDLQRDNQGENGATIWMRMPLRGCRREGVARP